MIEEDVAPSVHLLESMRSVGYSLNAAIADLIDNSIAVKARTVDIDLDPVDAEYVAILDDGEGMSPSTALEALRLAGSVGERSKADLGRFGLGLKTASLSQARCLTVVTKREGELTALRWDIDYIRQTGRWSLLRLSASETARLPWMERLTERKEGTLVVWQRLDLLLGDAPDRSQFVHEKIAPLMDSLGLVFHRFLHGRPDGLRITVNGNVVKALDPFLTSNPRTQASPTQYLAIGHGEVGVTAYTLPHVSGLSAEERRRPDLGERMRESQGFYIYRNARLISHGHWYGLARMDELSKQTRIQVDVPNTIDHLWQLDIKKSRAEPPASFKAELRRLMAGVIEKGKRVYTYRGRKDAGVEVVHLWAKIRERDGVRYEVNLDNPLVEASLRSLPPDEGMRMRQLLDALAKGFPAHDLFAEMAGNVRVVGADSSEDRTMALESIRAFRDASDPRLSTATALAVLKHAEPFNTMNDLEEIVQRIWIEDVDGAN